MKKFFKKEIFHDELFIMSAGLFACTLAVGMAVAYAFNKLI